MSIAAFSPNNHELVKQVPGGFTRSEGKTLIRRQNRELSHGLVTATRVQAAAVVATAGLHATAMLSCEATVQADGDPAVANRLNFIVDTYATFVGGQIARFGQ